jgi:hypothetical protein
LTQTDHDSVAQGELDLGKVLKLEEGPNNMGEEPTFEVEDPYATE